SPSDTIIITDNEELLSLELGSSRPRRAPRCDYSYRDFESIIVESVANKTDTTLSRKYKRTETKELSTLTRKTPLRSSGGRLAVKYNGYKRKIV
ncbi:uncharacterized protein N7479_007872, partial [Penicillium vulpinum]|uniref:uncharacterized protein n=1 Tax=Penicillium vulpinum TaxID=29845 RepID=UPI002546A15D